MLNQRPGYKSSETRQIGQRVQSLTSYKLSKQIQNIWQLQTISSIQLVQNLMNTMNIYSFNKEERLKQSKRDGK